MSRIPLALAACLILALAPLPVWAGDSESRGYGGPLSVGPNFETGEQHDTPTYDKKSTAKHPTKKRGSTVAKRKKAPAAKDADTEESTEAAKAPSSETVEDAGTSTESATSEPAGATSPTETAAGTSPPPCKKYVPTLGTTITVPCE